MKQKSAIIKTLSVLLISSMLFMSCSSNSVGTMSSENRLEDIKQRGYITVTTEPYFAPNEFIDPSKKGDEKYVGSDIEMAKYIADSLEVELRIVPLEFSAVIAGVVEGKYDLAISSLAYTPERDKALQLSKGYFFSKTGEGHGLLVRESELADVRNANDLSDKIVSVQSGSLQELFLNEQVPNYAQVKRASSSVDAYLMIQENKADVAITSIDLAKLYIAANPNCGLAIVEDFNFEQDESTLGVRIGIPKGEPELTEFINGVVDELVESGTYDQWYLEAKEYATSLGL